MALPAGEETLRLVAILDHDHGRADDVFALGLVRLLDAHVADEVRRARGRRLHADAGVLQALDPRLHQLAVDHRTAKPGRTGSPGRAPPAPNRCRPRRTAPSTRGSAARRAAAPRGSGILRTARDRCR